MKKIPKKKGRPTCKLMGVEFPLPIQLDEIPTSEAGSGDSYFVLTGNGVSERGDYNRMGTHTDSIFGMTHWTSAGAEKHQQALKKLNAYLAEHAR